MELPRWCSGKEPACQWGDTGDMGSNPGSGGSIFWRRKLQPTPGFLWMRIRGLCELSDGRDWDVGKTRSCSGGQSLAQQNFNPLVCWWVFGLRWPSLGVYRFYGKAKGDLQEDLCQDAFSQDFWCQCPYAWGRPLPTSTSVGDAQTFTDWSGSVSCGVTVPFPQVLVCTGFVCALQEWSVWFPQAFGSSIPLAFKVRFPGDSQPLCQIPRLGSLMWGQESSQKYKNFFGIIFSSLWVAHLEGKGFYFVMIVPFLPSHCGFSFVLGLGYLFSVDSSALLSMVVQQLV